jgi:signal transduction histidine kinase
VVLQAQAARIVARRKPALLDGTLADIESAGTGALAAMRRVIGILRDGDAAGLAAEPEQLTELIRRFVGQGTPATLRLPDGPADPSWPPEVTTTVYRVVAEALTNIARHAPSARGTTVTLAHDRRAVTAEVTDDASATHPRRFPGTGGYGLLGMRERVRTLGGTLVAGPCPEGGWSVRATVPFSTASAAVGRP